ncbi:MAG: ATP-binding protein [Pseudomonadota bacterium]
MPVEVQVESAPPALPAGLQEAAPLTSLRVLALLCIVLPLLVFLAVGAYRYQQMRDEAEVRLDRALRVAREHALKILDTNDIVLDRVLDIVGTADAAAIAGREPELHLKLKALSRDKPQIQSIWLWDADGKPLVTNRVSPVPPLLDVADRSYYRYHQARSGGLHISEPMKGRTTQDDFIVISRGRYSAPGDFAGMVSIGLSPTYLASFHRDLVADEPGLAVTMLREDGTIISRYPALPSAPPALAQSSPVMTKIRAGQAVGTANGVSSVDGRERLLSYSKVGNYPVYIGTGMDIGEIQQRWLREMAWLAAFGLPPLLGLFLTARIALGRTREALKSARRLNEETATRRRAEEALLQAQKLEALGRLTGGVAHDFNNALMVISNNLFLLKRKHPQADGPQIESIGRAVGSATKLTRQLLAFSRRQALLPEYVRLHERLASVEDLLGPVLGSQVEISVHTAPDTRTILVDSAELELALINLAINARDAMPSGGRFSIQARNADGPLPPPLTGRMVLIEISDTGVGIPPEVIDKVFEPFFTTKPVGEGTGLGLSQIYGLCQRAGGLATISSRVGLGTTVRLFFPATEEPATHVAAAPANAMPQLRKSILVVEDNDEVAAALVPVLEAMGCSVTRLDRASDAKVWLSAQARLPDLLLTDVVMPGEMDGVGLAQYARQTFPKLAIVLMTGYAEQMESIARLGFEIIPKPCSPEVMAETLERVSRRQPGAVKPGVSS